MSSYNENLEAVITDLQDLREDLIRTLDDRLARLVRSLTDLCVDQNNTIRKLEERLAEYEEEGR